MVIRGSKAKSDKVPTEVMTLARNMARAIVKGELKKKGFKISLIKSAQITKAANLLLTQRPELIQKAQADYNAQQEEAEGESQSVIVGIAEDPELKAKAAKAKADKQLSAAKAGKVATRGRPGLNA
jgi:regulator of protease activity HflC (stomatin/prohibitin superfamily)